MGFKNGFSFRVMIVSILIHSYSSLHSLSGDKDDPDINRDILEIIKSRGFDVQVHTAVTKDGYILTIHRIVNPYYKGILRPVLLQHGLFSTAADFVINSAGGDVEPKFNKDACQTAYPANLTANTLGFVLSKHGYDVWMANSRGTSYSRNHTKLNPERKEFWQFSFDQMIDYDLPAVISYILQNTKQDKLSYIGHSQGTTLMLGLLASQPEYAKVIKPFIALAPVASFWKIRTPLRYIAEMPFLASYLRDRGGSFLPDDGIMHYIASHFCESPIRAVCDNTLFLFTGYDFANMNQTRLPVYLTHSSPGTSNWNVAHFLQMVKSKVLTRFDYGIEKNFEIYGQATPPYYPLKNINSKYISLMYGENDWLADPQDVAFLRNYLKVQLFDYYKVPFSKWNHLDFLWAESTGVVLNPHVLDVLRKTLNCTSGSSES